MQAAKAEAEAIEAHAEAEAESKLKIAEAEAKAAQMIGAAYKSNPSYLKVCASCLFFFLFYF